MGCDIHFFAERRNEAGEWEYLPAPDDGYDYDIARAVREKLGTDSYKPPHPYRFASDERKVVNGYEVWDGEPFYMRDWFDDRNYKLFALLAGVRNYDGVEPIAEPRGWPDDLSPELEAERKHIEHTPSWFTVAELQDYFARMHESLTPAPGIVDGATYERLRDTGETPESWCSSIAGNGIVIVEPDVYDAIPAHCIDHCGEGFGAASYVSGHFVGSVHPIVKVHVRVNWQDVMSEYTKRFEDCLAELASYGECRVLFYFDS